jgi:hypothetical protein
MKCGETASHYSVVPRVESDWIAKHIEAAWYRDDHRAHCRELFATFARFGVPGASPWKLPINYGASRDAFGRELLSRVPKLPPAERCFVEGFLP